MRSMAAVCQHGWDHGSGVGCALGIWTEVMVIILVIGYLRRFR